MQLRRTADRQPRAGGGPTPGLTPPPIPPTGPAGIPEPLPPGGVSPEIPPCLRRAAIAEQRLVTQAEHLWQNWGKNISYICDRMMFPTSVDEIGAAIRKAEREGASIRAAGGGWSFSDVVLPENAHSFRPVALGVEAIAEVKPLAQTYPTHPLDPVVARVGDNIVPPDAPGSLVMWNPTLKRVDRRWTYRGDGLWASTPQAVSEVIQNLMFEYIMERGGHAEPMPLREPLDPDAFQALRDGVDPREAVIVAYAIGCRPIPATGADGPGSLVMYDYLGGFLHGGFYHGGGMWTSAPGRNTAARQSLQSLVYTLPPYVQPRLFTPAAALRQMAPYARRAYIINTQSLASSLQQNLPSLLSAAALRAISPGGSGDSSQPHRYLFHVEGGITMSALSELLVHQSPPLALEATAGSPGATLAGMLSTATHGGEYNRPLLVDRVKAIHLVGPGGLQWWIEGSESIADPARLLEAYPCLAPERIIAGSALIQGILPQDWLNAVVVSMGCMGVIYSVVLEVVPHFGIHEAIVQTNWRALIGRARFNPDGRGERAVTLSDLRSPPADADSRRALGTALFELLASGELNGTGISNNRYIDLAIDPNSKLLSGSRDWTCWVLNREVTASVPFDPKPLPTDTLGLVVKKLTNAIKPASIADRLMEIFNVDFIRRFQDQAVPADAVVRAMNQIPYLVPKLERLLSSTDLIDTLLDLFAGPIEEARDFEVASAIVSAVFSGLMRIENGRSDTTDASSRVGNVGFPASGVMGAAAEIALPLDHAFTFIQTEILDRLSYPFWGYVSVRVCPRTNALLGMQQFDPSVMVEVVAFGTDKARAVVNRLQQRAVDAIREGTDALLHWGLENDRLDAETLRSIGVLNRGSPSKLELFRRVRSAIHAAAGLERNVFNNGFTRRLEL